MIPLLIAALAAVLAPCEAAIPSAPSCPMAGCAGGSAASFTPACCCDPSGAPAAPAAGAVVLLEKTSHGPAGTPVSVQSPGTEPPIAHVAPDRAPAAPDPVPIYLLNASLLI